MQYIAECDGGLCRQGSGDRLSLCRGFTAGAPMSRRYPVEGAPGPSLLGTGEEVSTNSRHSYVLLGSSPKPQVALARRLNWPDMPPLDLHERFPEAIQVGDSLYSKRLAVKTQTVLTRGAPL